jgi:ATP-dependent Clp protease ATP-binding subunit ClpC
VNEELKQYFRPEFLNRIDEIIVFRQLTQEEVKHIADLMLAEVSKRMKEKNIILTVTERFKELLVREGYNPAYGARPLRRAIMRLLEDSMAEEILTGKVREGASVVVDVDDDGKVVCRDATPALDGTDGTLQLMPAS